MRPLSVGTVPARKLTRYLEDLPRPARSSEERVGSSPVHAPGDNAWKDGRAKRQSPHSGHGEHDHLPVDAETRI